MLTNDNGAWLGEVLSFAHAMYLKCYAKKSSQLSKGFYILYMFAQSVSHSIIPSCIVYTVPWSSSLAIVLRLYICNLLTRLLAWEEQTGQDSMSSHHLKMLQSADKHLTKRLFRYAGSGAILINDYLSIGIYSQSCQFQLVKEMLANSLQSVPTKSYPNVFIISTCNPPQCNCFNLYM